jgi:cytoskeleton-associated protein 5
MLLEHGLRSKVAKTRQGALDEISLILKKSGMGACDPTKAFPSIAAMISDKDSQVRKSALTALRSVARTLLTNLADVVLARAMDWSATKFGR